MGFGGLIAIIGGLVFLYVVLEAMLGSRTDLPANE